MDSERGGDSGDADAVHIVVVVPYDPRRSSLFDGERDRLAAIFDAAGGPRVRRAWLLLALAALIPLAVSAQGTVVGGVGGAANTEQLWKPDEDTRRYTGAVLGAFAEAETPAGFSLVAEGTWTRRGGDVVVDVAGRATPGRLRMDYLTVAVHVKLRRSLGPVSGHVLFGPTLDQVLDSSLDPALSQVFDEEKTQVFSVAAGVGLEGWIGERVRVGFDLRLTEGLSSAYDGDFTEVRNRSVESLLRVGIPLSVLRGS